MTHLLRDSPPMQEPIWCTTPHHNRFTALLLGPPGWAGARRELLDFMVQGEINRGRHTDHPAGRYCIRTKLCPLPPSPHSLQAGCPSFRPTSSIKAQKANKHIQIREKMLEFSSTVLPAPSPYHKPIWCSLQQTGYSEWYKIGKRTVCQYSCKNKTCKMANTNIWIANWYISILLSSFTCNFQTLNNKYSTK